MDKPFCKMSLKELLEHLNSSSQETNETKETPELMQADQASMEDRKLNYVTLDETALRLIIRTSGVHPISRN